MNNKTQRDNSFKLCLIFALAIIFGFQQTASARTYYTTSDPVGSFQIENGSPWSFAYGINSSGQVVGTARSNALGSPLSAFLWQNGTLTDLGAIFPTVNTYGNSNAYGINDTGTVVGEGAFVYGSLFHALVWENGVGTDLQPLIWQSGVFQTTDTQSLGRSKAWRVNNAGQVIGDWHDISGTGGGFIYQNGVFTKRECASPTGNILAYDLTGINNQGDVVGVCDYGNYLWSAGGSVTNLGALEPVDINDSGIILGGTQIGYSYRRSYIYENGVVTNLGVLYGNDTQIGNQTYALAINNSNQVVGYGTFDLTAAIPHGFLYENGVMKDLNELTHPSSDGSYLSQCTDINDQGQITCLRKLLFSNETPPSVVLTPVQDTTAPQVSTNEIITHARSTLGAFVDFGAGVSDDWDRNPSISYSRQPGTLFPIGTTTVGYLASDVSGNTRTGTFQITVIDTPPEGFSLPEPIYTDATSAAGAIVNFIASAWDIVDGELTISCNPASGSIFPVGETTVTCSATDSANNTRIEEFKVYVLTAGQESTPVGEYIPVEINSDFNMTFEYVTEPGITTVQPIDPANIGTTPAGFAVSNVAYQIDTTAVFDYYGTGVQLTFVVPLIDENADGQFDLTNAEFENLAVLHNHNGVLEELQTIGRDYATRTIRVITYSFSPFYLGIKNNRKIETLFDRGIAYKKGSTIPVKIKVRSMVNNNNLSSSSLPITARSIKRLGTSEILPVVDAGSANSDSNFRYLGGTDGSYIFNLKTKDLAAGRYALSFYVGTDRSFFYTVEFQIK